MGSACLAIEHHHHEQREHRQGRHLAQRQPSPAKLPDHTERVDSAEAAQLAGRLGGLEHIHVRADSLGQRRGGEPLHGRGLH